MTDHKSEMCCNCKIGYGIVVINTELLTSDKQLNSSSGCYLFLKGFTLCLQVRGIAIKDVGVFCFYVYVLEEVIPHEGVVALRMISGKAYSWQILMSVSYAWPQLSRMCQNDQMLYMRRRNGDNLPTYSSMLKVFTYWNEMSPLL